MSEMSENRVVVGVFEYLDDVVNAVKVLKDKKLNYRLYSPTMRHEIEDATFPEKSPVRKVTFCGGLTGITFGFSLAILCSLDWPLRVSAKDVVSVPGFVVIGYECLILFAALSTFGAMLHFCRIPDIFRKVGYRPEFNSDRFGLVVQVSRDEIEPIRTHLEKSGAQLVEVKEGL